MRESQYNIYVNTPKGIICFNTLHETFALLPVSLYGLLKNGFIDKISGKDQMQLFQNGFLINNEDSELQILEKEYKTAIDQNNEIYNLTLLPSLDCNLRCWYCFESHVKGSHLTAETRENILDYAQKILWRKEIKELKIELFGGEPLLYFETELYPLLIRIKRMCETCGKKILITFITNATCITDRHVPLFAELDAKFQISIDGYKEKHNQIKRDVNTKEKTYERVMTTIHSLCQGYKSCHINLRINYDNETLQYIPNVLADISDIDRHQIRIHLERVWQTNAQTSSAVSVGDAIRQILSRGFIVSYMNLFRRSYSCKSSKKEQAVISYDGKVYKCTGRNFTSKMQEGILVSGGKIIWDEEKLEKRLDIKTFKFKECISCKLLPLCWGPCNQKQLEYPDELERFCQLKHMEISLEEYVFYAFNNQLLKEKLYATNE